jgi:LysM repeat protein
MEALLQDKNLKRICIIIILSLWAWSVIGNNSLPSATINSFIQSVPGDSVGVKTIEGKSFVVYQMGKGETAYAVSRKFGVPYKDIAAANNGVDMGALKVGQQILVPVSFNKSAPVASVSNTESVNTQKVETVQVETINTIAPPPPVTENKTEIIAQSNTEVKQEVVSEIANAEMNSTTEISTTEQSGEKSKNFAMLFADYQSENRIANSEKGAATWIENNSIETSGDRFYALSNTAPVGSIIKVRNMMNNRVVYAKVIGKLSESEVNAKVMVKLSAGAGERLNVLDNRFVVEVSYYLSAD